MGWRKKTKNSGEYTRSTPAFSDTHHRTKTGGASMYTSQSMDQPGKVASPARGQLNSNIFLSSFAPEKLV